MDNISEAKTLAELADILNALDSDEVDAQGYDGSNYPTFGGSEPQETQEVWSYDPDSILVCDGNCCYSIAPRCKCGEATFHCICSKNVVMVGTTL